jgi:hypothetical protein
MVNTIPSSNKKILIFIGIVVIGILAYFGYQQYRTMQADKMVPTATEILKNEEFGISFAYPVGDNGLIMIEPPASDNGVKKAYLLMTDSDYTEYTGATEPREAPESISVLVLMLEDATSTTATIAERESRITRLQNWAMDNKTLTSYHLAKATPDIIEIDGLKTLHYKADGLYQQDIYLTSYKGRVYMFTAQYNEETDLTYTAFQEIMKTVLFD